MINSLVPTNETNDTVHSRILATVKQEKTIHTSTLFIHPHYSYYITLHLYLLYSIFFPPTDTAITVY